MELKGQMQVTSWQEDDLRGLDNAGGKITRASIGYRMSGDVDGESADDVVMCYRPDGTAAVIGLWQVSGSVAGRVGSVVFESLGGYDGTTASGGADRAWLGDRRLRQRTRRRHDVRDSRAHRVRPQS